MKSKIILVCLLTTCCISTYCQTSDSKRKIDGTIQQVENGLLPPILITSQKGYTLMERMAHYRVPGVSIAVVADFKIDWVRSYGVKDAGTGEPVTPETIFQAASISKPITAMAALKLVEKGKLGLEENINKYLISWKIPDSDLTKENPVTLKNLLSHTGGLVPAGFNGYRRSQDIPGIVQILNGEKPANSPRISLTRVPGSNYQYSGGGYEVVQMIMMDLEKKPFGDIMNESIFLPLSLSHSSFNQPLSSLQEGGTSSGHLINGIPVTGKRNVYPELAAAGLWTTSEDLAKILIEIQKSNSGKSNLILSQKSVDEMLTPYLSRSSGLGFNIEQGKKGKFFGHNGSNLGFRCMMIASLENGYGAVVMTNGEMGGDLCAEIIRGIAKVYQWADYLPEEVHTVPLETNKLRNLTGKYQLDLNTSLSVKLNNGFLYLSDSWGDEYQLFPISDNRFVVETSGDEYQFVKNETDNSYSLNVKSRGRDQAYKRVPQDRQTPMEVLMAGDESSAFSEFSGMKSKDPENICTTWMELDRIAYEGLRNGKVEKSGSIFKINIGINPEIAVCYYGMGDFYLKTGNDTLALEYFLKTLKIAKEYPSENSQFSGLLVRTKEQIEMLGGEH
jgi:CubicO group peptidase (beta-lactamase class C family)